jgi:hypothetical protein
MLIFLPRLHFSKRRKTWPVMCVALQATNSNQAPAASENNVAPNVSGHQEPTAATSGSENRTCSITEGPSGQNSRDLQETIESADSNKRQKILHGEHAQEGQEHGDEGDLQQVS